MLQKRFLCAMAVLILLGISAQAFAQSSISGSFSGTVKDPKGLMVPGANVMVKNTESGVENKYVTNNTGTFNAPGLLPGYYEITVEKEGFAKSITSNIRLENGIHKLDVKLEAGQKTDVVEVNIKAENIILENGPSVGTVIPEETIAKLPLVNSNVLDLVKVMGGVVMTENPIFGADDTTLAGLSASHVNVQKDGVTANNVRWVTGMNTPVNLNPEMVSEFKVIVTPVDAEMGRGSGQIQVVTRSGGNAYRGSVVWNVQNSAFNSSSWSDNKNRTKPTWRNQNEWIAQGSGPLIKNKTFIFALFDYTRSMSKQTLNIQVPTACARKGIYRYFDGYQNGNYYYSGKDPASPSRASNPLTRAVVDALGNPVTNLVQPDYMGDDAGKPSKLEAFNIFGGTLPSGWDPASDPKCEQIPMVTDKANTYYNFPDLTYPSYGTTTGGSKYDQYRDRDQTGYVGRFMDLVLLPNNFRSGDGLNWGAYSWTRRNMGIDNAYGIGETPNRKQINIRLDHNLSNRHRGSVSYTYETNRGDDAMRTMPEPYGFGGTINRKPQTLSVTLTSTLRPSLLNELRVGFMRTSSWVNGPMQQPETGAQLRQLIYDLLPTADWANLQGSKIDIPVLVSLPNFQIGSNSQFHPYGSGRGNMGIDWGSTDPRWTFADTITWQFGRHSLRIGGEMQRTSSFYKEDGVKSMFGGSTPSVFPIVNGGAATNAGITGYDPPAPGCGDPTKYVYWGGGYGYKQGCYSISSWNNGFGPGSTFQFNVTQFYNFAGQVGAGTSHSLANAGTLLNIFSGSVQSVSQFFFINSPTQTRYNSIKDGEMYKYTDFYQNQLNWFAQDNWRVSDDLTLQLGMRWEWYGVPYLGNGMTAGFLGGGLSAFGVSGRGFDSWLTTHNWNYGQDVTAAYNNCSDASGAKVQCDLTKLAFIGPDSPHPEQNFYNDDYNNFGPVAGFAYTLPWGGKGKTVLRGGIQISYLTFGRADNAISNMPGVTYSNSVSNSGNYMDLSDVKNYIPVSIQSWIQTPAVKPATPLDQRSQYVTAYDPNIRTPYTESLNLRLTRTIGSSLTVDLIYAGNLGRKTSSTVNLNTPNMISNGLFDALKVVRAGGESDLINKMVGTYNITGAGTSSTLSGSQQLHVAYGTYAGYSTLVSALANGNFTSIADWFATANVSTANNKGVTAAAEGTSGQLLRLNGFPENFIYANPQYRSLTWNANMNKSSYHSLQAQIQLRPTHGLMLSATYTWSKNMGYNSISDYTNRDIDYGMVGGRKHALTSYGTYDLPFGPNRWLFSSVSPNVLGRIIGGWQLSWIHTMSAGSPQTLTGDVNYLWGGNMMSQALPFDFKSGYVDWKPNASNGNYYANKYSTTTDPQCSNTELVASDLRYSCTLKAVVLSTHKTDDQDYVFVNTIPGQQSNLGRNTFTSPMRWSTDGALSKSIRISEGKSFQIRVDATNIFNHAQPADPGYSISSYTTTPFQISSKSGQRTFQARLRFDF